LINSSAFRLAISDSINETIASIKVVKSLTVYPYSHPFPNPFYHGQGRKTRRR